MKNFIILTVIIMTWFGYGAAINSQIVKFWINTAKGFEPNVGQIADFEKNPSNDVFCSFKDNGFVVFITKSGVSYVIYQPERIFKNDTKSHKTATKSKPCHYARIDLELVGANLKRTKLIYEDEIEGYTNYYLSHVPDGILHRKSYKKVRIKDVYPNIDWVWRYDGRLHHEFELAPGADVSKIKLKVKYADTEILDNGKRLIYYTPLGKIQDGAVVGYEVASSGVSGPKLVDVCYHKDKQGLIGFQVGEYSVQNTLIIDPPLSLVWATYYGGTLEEFGYSVTTDAKGNIFVTGEVSSTDFPVFNPGGRAYFQGTNAGDKDFFILKFTNTGVRKWATYYGGSDYDWCASITTDASGNIFGTGFTGSKDFPVFNPKKGAYFQETNAGDIDVFILKFTNTGVRKWATYYGGSEFDMGHSITTDDSGNVFITGGTQSKNYPIYNPGGVYCQKRNAGDIDIFILKFTNTGIRRWATFYGGSGDDRGYSITTDASGNIFVTGESSSKNFPVFNPGNGAHFQQKNAGDFDAYILKFTNTGVRLWATYYGGAKSDPGFLITTDGLGNVFVTGRTESKNFPVFNPGGGAYFQQKNAGDFDAYILKFTNTGVREWATYYGGRDFDWGISITTDIAGNVYATGNTMSKNFPVYNPGGNAFYKGKYAGEGDAFILKFTNNGIRKWATYYGGNDLDFGCSITTDALGNIFVFGPTSSTDIPLRNPGGNAYFQEMFEGITTIYILKFETAITETKK